MAHLVTSVAERIAEGQGTSSALAVAVLDLRKQLAVKLKRVAPLLAGVCDMEPVPRDALKCSHNNKTIMKLPPSALAEHAGLAAQAIYYRYASHVKHVEEELCRLSEQTQIQQTQIDKQSELERRLEDLIRRYASFCDFIDVTVEKYATMFTQCASMANVHCRIPLPSLLGV
jgi:hypothetical protein